MTERSIAFEPSPGKRVLTMRGDGTIEVGEGVAPDEAARQFVELVRERWFSDMPRWKPIDDAAKDGSLWPVADAAGSRGLARYSDGGWVFLAHLPDSNAPMLLRAKDSAQHPVVYFDIPDPPRSEKTT